MFVLRSAEHVGCGAVDGSVPAAAAPVGDRPRVAEQCQHQAVAHPADGIFVAGEPGDGADRDRRKHEAVAVARRTARSCERAHVLREQTRHADARQVVVAQRRMAHVGAEQDLVGRLAGHEQFPVRQAAVLERRVDAHLVLVVGELRELVVAEAEPPVVAVEAAPERDPAGMIRQRIQARLELGEPHLRRDRDAVTHQVQVVASVVDHAFAARVLHILVLHVPLARHDPVENRRSR
jgi:hypothetical protein